MRRYKYYLGWDVSQLTLNFCVRDQLGEIIDEGVISNTDESIKLFFEGKLSHWGVSAKAVFSCVEQTGLYGFQLVKQSYCQGISVCQVDALRINKANHRRHDKTDRADARLICEYGYQRDYQLTLWKPPSAILLKIRGLHRRRRNLARSLQSMSTSMKAGEQYDESPLDAKIIKSVKKVIEELKAAIALIDEKVTELILREKELKRLYEIVRSCFGCGPKNTVVILLETGFFKKIPTAKACSNYAGLRPREYQSGTSVKRRKRASKKVNKQLKTAFHQAAFCASTKSKIYREYYLRKKAEGKT
ncbi:MAG: transposase, partial [Bacteroidota bacterium]